MSLHVNMYLYVLWLVLLFGFIVIALPSDRIVFPQIDDFEIDCKLPDGAQGMCRTRRACPNALTSRERVKTCYFEKFEQFVCCREDPKSYASDLACNDYYPAYTEIISGLKTLPREFPYMVALGFATPLEAGKYEYKCGGALIAPSYVITAAHCVNVGGVEPAVVLPGGVNLTDKSVKLREIAEIIVHPQYEPKSAYNDIALLKLNSSIYSLSPACIGRNLLLENENATAIGYGHQVFGGRSSDQLLKAPLQIVGNDVCAPHYTDIDQLSRGLQNNQLCAQDLQARRDTCQGDSGGPLILWQRNYDHTVPYIVGITSFGLGCATEAPGVYTRVDKYLDWIEPIVWPPTNNNDKLQITVF